VCLFRYFNMGLAVEEPPHIMRWYQQLSQRTAFRHTIMQPFDELEGCSEF
jgi:glutathione S-transferase